MSGRNLASPQRGPGKEESVQTSSPLPISPRGAVGLEPESVSESPVGLMKTLIARKPIPQFLTGQVWGRTENLHFSRVPR